jgi:enoyl-CoA hydratase/carnithine racemase
MSAATKLSSKINASVAAATQAASEALAAGAPKYVTAIPSVVRYGPIALSELADHTGRIPGAAIRQVGAMRRIFLFDPHLTRTEMDGLCHRIKVLNGNTSINSILLANNVQKEANCMLPTSALDDDELEIKYFLDDPSSAGIGKVHYVAAGYNPRSLADMKKDDRRRTINALMRLTLAVKGQIPVQKQQQQQQQQQSRQDKNKKNSSSIGETSEFASKIPFISVPHGLTTDGGYALSMGSYVLATSDSRYRIMNPLRGLSLDPIGLSYILPRLGHEFSQPSARFPVGSVLALTGYEADESDMVETGLATHFIDSYGKLAYIERGLAELPSYEQQVLLKEPTKRYGESENSGGRSRDINAKFRNKAVASLLYNCSSYDAMGQEIINPKDVKEFFADEDPSLVLENERVQPLGDRESMLVNIAATFQDAFNEDSVEGIMERMREYSSMEAKDVEEVECVEIAKTLYESMKAQSPLALCATHKLMRLGADDNETLQACMEREKTVILNLFEKKDFKNWASSGAKEGDFLDWAHKSIKDVSKDEIEELFK